MFEITAYRTLLFAAFLLPAGCAVQPSVEVPRGIEVAFSPEAGSEVLVLKVLATAKETIRLSGYTFTSPAVVRGLIDAKKRGVDVRLVLDDKGNHSRASVVAMNLVVGAEIPVRTISKYAIHHDKFIVVDGIHTETGSFNYSQAAARSNSENVLVVWNDAAVAKKYLSHWESRWSDAVTVRIQAMGAVID